MLLASSKPAYSPNAAFLTRLRELVSSANVLTGLKARPYQTGFRCGQGRAVAVVRPRSLIELWRVIDLCVREGKIVIMQAANTGLTGGSTPDGDDYPREVVLINTLLIDRLHLIDQGRQVVCLPGTTLDQLERALKPLGREPHSVIGSSCIGASVMGGICNNSGGALVRRGPAYTQLALFAQLDADGRLHLVNHLGIHLGEDPEQILDRLERGAFTAADIVDDPAHPASDHEYARHVRAIDAERPARFNADPRRLFEASGSAGRIVLFAVRLDTFPKEPETRVFYIGTRDPAELASLRRHVLSRFESLPVAGEYLHRDTFDIAARYGKDTFLAIRHFGTARLGTLFRTKRALERLGQFLGFSNEVWVDRLLQHLSRLFPNHLPARLRAFRNRFEHHLLLKMAGPGVPEAADYLKTVFPSPSGDYFECTDEEGRAAFLHRFAAAGAAVRYRAVHEVGELVALDFALRRNDREWCKPIPGEIRDDIALALSYGHFFCHVFHNDYLVRKGGDAETVKQRLLGMLEECGAEYPAEHNVGHQYRAKPELAAFYRSLDPCNRFNPGIGKTSKRPDWQ